MLIQGFFFEAVTQYGADIIPRKAECLTAVGSTKHFTTAAGRRSLESLVWRHATAAIKKLVKRRSMEEG